MFKRLMLLSFVVVTRDTCDNYVLLAAVVPTELVSQGSHHAYL